MNILLFNDTDRCSGGGSGQDSFDISITGERLVQLQSLLARHPRGQAAGHFIRVGELGGRVGKGEVLSSGAERVLIRVTLQALPAPKLPVTLILALPRPKMLRRILRLVSELGVPELHLINAMRVEKSYWQSPALAPEVMRAYLMQGIMQTGDTVLPQVSVHRSFKQFVERRLESIVGEHKFLVAHPGDFPLCSTVAGVSPSCLAVGPEGGFTASEVDHFQACRAQCVSLGSRVLRVETALPVVLSPFLMSP